MDTLTSLTIFNLSVLADILTVQSRYKIEFPIGISLTCIFSNPPCRELCWQLTLKVFEMHANLNLQLYTQKATKLFLISEVCAGWPPEIAALFTARQHYCIGQQSCD